MVRDHPEAVANPSRPLIFESPPTPHDLTFPHTVIANRVIVAAQVLVERAVLKAKGGRFKRGERGPDVTPYLGWYPVVTFLQIACDLPMATSVPDGYGHNISPDSYLDAWIEVTECTISPDDLERLRPLFETPDYEDSDEP